ncbi:MAG: VWA domain-containing protein, partial [Pedobacter sp.]
SIPATDGHTIWLPKALPLIDAERSQRIFRTIALQQAMRAVRGSASYLAAFKVSVAIDKPNPVVQDLFLLLENYSADETLVQLLPGMRNPINQLREWALKQRPPLAAFGEARRPLERFYRTLLEQSCGSCNSHISLYHSPAESMAAAESLLPQLMKFALDYDVRSYGTSPLMKDVWTGELRQPNSTVMADLIQAQKEPTKKFPKSAHLPRRPDIRKAVEDEDKQSKSANIWMVQGDESHAKAEDPLGMLRPVDRDDGDAGEFADLVSELSEARVVSTPSQSKEVLLSDESFEKQSRFKRAQITTKSIEMVFPEWDYRQKFYRVQGSTVLVSRMGIGKQIWVDNCHNQHRTLIHGIQRQFDMLRARQVTQRHQIDGEEIDLDAYVTSIGDFRAGNSLDQALYQTRRVAVKDIAISLLVDVSGSTDSWIAEHRRVIDVEREALLLVAIALQSFGQPYSICAFSGEGANAVVMHQVKDFDENFSNDVALRVAALEPERYTRMGAALRYSTAELMKHTARHRLLIVLSDGKPNDNDDYEGRYGIEDTRQAVSEAIDQGIQPFCLTVDNQAADYLPKIFGRHRYALLPNPNQLPRVLLEWMKRLLIVS